jgi:hypothetical protein
LEILKLDYIFISTLLYVLFAIYGYRASKKNKNNFYKNYWSVVLLPIILYSFIEGLRYDRGVDYMLYLERYTSFSSSYLDERAFFDWFNFGMISIGIPFYIAFIIYSLVFISAVLFFLKDYREVAHYSFLLLLPATLFYSETFISQFFSISFVFIAIKYILRGYWIKFLIFATIAVLFHNSSAFIILIIILLLKYNKPFNIYLTIPIYVFFSLLFDMKNISLITPYLGRINLGGDNHMQLYVENADVWFSKEAVNSIYEQNIIAKIANFLFDVSILIAGSILVESYKNRNKEQSLVLFYNLFAIGAILYQAFFQIELMRRLAIEMYLFWFIVVAYIINYYQMKRKTSPLFKYMVIIIVTYVISLCFKYVFLVQDSLFIWDKY